MVVLSWLLSSTKASIRQPSPTCFFLSPRSTNHYFLLSLQVWGGDSSYHQSSQGYGNPLIVFLPQLTPLSIVSLSNLSQITQLECALYFLPDSYQYMSHAPSSPPTIYFGDSDTLIHPANHSWNDSTSVNMGPWFSSWSRKLFFPFLSFLSPVEYTSREWEINLYCLCHWEMGMSLLQQVVLLGLTTTCLQHLAQLMMETSLVMETLSVFIFSNIAFF